MEIQPGGRGAVPLHRAGFRHIFAGAERWDVLCRAVDYYADGAGPGGLALSFSRLMPAAISSATFLRMTRYGRRRAQSSLQHFYGFYAAIPSAIIFFARRLLQTISHRTQAIGVRRLRLLSLEISLLLQSPRTDRPPCPVPEIPRPQAISGLRSCESVLYPRLLHECDGRQRAR